MSFDKAFRQLIQQEVQAAIAPLAAAIDDLPQKDLVAKLSRLLGGAGARRGRPRRGRRATNAGRPCAVIGCTRPVRSKGYCAAHYQKQRMLERTHRRPSDWKDDAAPQSVMDLVLPRGRAGAKALAAARKK